MGRREEKSRHCRFREDRCRCSTCASVCWTPRSLRFSVSPSLCRHFCHRIVISKQTTWSVTIKPAQGLSKAGGQCAFVCHYVRQTAAAATGAKNKVLSQWSQILNNVCCVSILCSNHALELVYLKDQIVQNVLLSERTLPSCLQWFGVIHVLFWFVFFFFSLHQTRQLLHVDLEDLSDIYIDINTHKKHFMGRKTKWLLLYFKYKPLLLYLWAL